VAVQDLHRQEELSAVVAVGLSAEEIVLVAGRLARGFADEADLPIAEYGARVLRALGDVASPFGLPSDTAGFMSSDGFIDAIRAVRAQAPGQDVKTYSEALAAALEKAARGEELAAADRELLERVRDLFGVVGKTAIARANDLSQPQRD
jgi:hypothetical protein